MHWAKPLLTSLVPTYVVSMLIATVGLASFLATFVAADPVLFKALPYELSGRLVELKYSRPQGARRVRYDRATLTQLHDTGLFERIGAYSWLFPGTIVSAGLGVEVAAVDDGFVELFVGTLSSGRKFHTSEFDGSRAACLITDRLHQEMARSGGAQVGEQIEVAGIGTVKCHLVGVLPRSFVFPTSVGRQPDILVPANRSPAPSSDPPVAQAFGRLPDGASATSITLRLRSLLSGPAHDDLSRPQPEAVVLHSSLLGALASGTILLTATALLVLLSATAGCMHLCRARCNSQLTELAFRYMLGASPVRLWLRCAMPYVGLTAAALLGALALHAPLRGLISTIVPRMHYAYSLLPTGIEARPAVALTVAATILLALAFCLPVTRAITRVTRQPLSAVSAGWSPGRLRPQAIWTVLMGQAASSSLALAAAVAVLTGFGAVAWQPMGFDYAAIRIVQPSLPERYYTTEASRRRGVNANIAGALQNKYGSDIAVTNGAPGMVYALSFRSADSTVEGPEIRAMNVSESFFDIAGIVLLRGVFPSDGPEKAGIVVDRRAAQLLWQTDEVIGRFVQTRQGKQLSVVGLVETVRTSLDPSDSEPGHAFAHLHSSSVGDSLMYVYRNGGPVTLEDVVRVVHAAEPLAFVDDRPLRFFEAVLAPQRFVLGILAVAAVTLLVLSAAGLLGIVIEFIDLRRSELAVRQALGASLSQQALTVAKRLVPPVVVGAMAGIVSFHVWVVGLTKSVVGQSQVLFWSDLVSLLGVTLLLGVGYLAVMFSLPRGPEVSNLLRKGRF